LDSGKKDERAQDGGACDGNWFDPKFLQPPFITMTENSITAEIPKDYEKTKACIHQGTTHGCQFYIGPNGVSNVEFDYHIEGDRYSNWFSFWINPVGPNSKWIKDAEIDSLENMYKSEAHNFAGLGHQVEFK